MKPLLIALAALLLVVGGYVKGSHDKAQKWALSEAKRIQLETMAALKTANTAIKQEKKTIEIVTKYIDRVQVVKEKGQTIIKEVPVYVQNDPDLSGGFRLLHDAAATNELPDSTRIADAPTVTAQDVAETVAENYQRCHSTAEQLIAIQSWIKQNIEGNNE